MIPMSTKPEITRFKSRDNLNLVSYLTLPNWADEDGNLETAYGHYWRHFPSAEKDKDGKWVVTEIDQIQYVIDESSLYSGEIVNFNRWA